MGSSTSKHNPKELLATPAMRGAVEEWLFNGLLLRIIDRNTGTWAFFNNSRDYEFHVAYLLNPDSAVQALSKTIITPQDDGVLCETSVYPLETQRFFVGDVTGFESKIEALPLSAEYLQSHADIDERKYYRRLIPPSAATF
ncbi:calpain-like cysteine peptidase, Clan CA, family C2 [Trypanosoma cruzi]|uniref:Putative calpain-like cysteine peptidase n=1 Tax=Trypanosoma cruzi TaxID=5693 RepID=A0A2V2VH45_TRYCR|nr:putative calpain-like cysteine peptidase, clan CA, family C2 [Trypanosoma cruzi]PBJ74036.1 calpain-like cysteine peptidase [Trypanosoma cruzi cruzi]PWU95474.1 putative calpain-like cysteine peptidase [Trypanosoma cruzi]RNF14257.1 calpain-like cysteine peptidase, Clan CA, family C2 [Trypanosoma cruzi]